jgi:reverse gyrase
VEKVKDDFDRLSKELYKYMKKQGWELLVLSSPFVVQNVSDKKYNFDLVFKFTGKKIK